MKRATPCCCAQAISAAQDEIYLPVIQTGVIAATPPPPPVAIAVPARPATATAPAALPAGGEAFFPLCNTVTISGTVTATGSIGSMHQAESCAAWAAGEDSPAF
ncbi:MAG: hypothetical protein KF832_23875 [Caldilineaceae bacterium]|nr:hypothetical protein [Caldilineaceae bacterium]